MSGTHEQACFCNQLANKENAQESFYNSSWGTHICQAEDGPVVSDTDPNAWAFVYGLKKLHSDLLCLEQRQLLS